MMHAEQLSPIVNHIQSQLIGQQSLVNSMLVCLLCDGHMLIEGMPGLAKTTAVKALAESIEGDFHRVQFTPDLLPSDLIGTDIYSARSEAFEFRPGPIFQNVLLADEINRSPAKVQSALLEAMAERQVTVGAQSYSLPDLFMVIATQNPIEQEGTYHLPEAQLDRFLLHVWVDYPNHDEEYAILELDHGRAQQVATNAPSLVPQPTLFEARRAATSVYLDDKLKRYIVDLTMASRNPSAFDPELARWSRFGASPRATIALARSARALAWLEGEHFVSPDHIQRMAPDVLSHRVILSFEAEAEGVDSRRFVDRLLQCVAVP